MQHLHHPRNQLKFWVAGEKCCIFIRNPQRKGRKCFFDSELRKKNLNFWTRRTILRGATKWNVKPFRFHDNFVVVVYMAPLVYNQYIDGVHYQPNHLPRNHHSCHHHNSCHRIDHNYQVAVHEMANVSAEYLNDERHDMLPNYEKV